MNPQSRQSPLQAFRQMLLVRRVEESIVAQYAEQNAAFAAKQSPAHTIKCPTHLSIGQEACAVGVCGALGNDDVVFSTHRCHAHYLAKGGNLDRMMAELFGRATGCCAGKGGSMHLTDVSVGMLGASAIVGGSIPLAVGAALSFKMRGLPHVAVAFFGDGAVEQGLFHESLNVASIRKLPVLFVSENNFYATLSSIDTRQSGPIAERAASYAMPGVKVDGTDVAAVADAAGQAVLRARRGDGPSLLELTAYRWMSHVGTEPDTGKMRRSEAELSEWKAKCPIVRARASLERDGTSPKALDEIDDEIGRTIAGAIAFAKASPEPTREAMFQHVGGGAR